MTCPYLEAKGWHMFVGYHKPDGTVGYACHGCGEYPTEIRGAALSPVTEEGDKE